MNKKNNDYDIYSVFEKQNKYKSPIEIFTSGHLDNINRVVDGKIISEITMRYGIFVDEQELVKALSYDREQYEKGWIDGFKEALEKPKPRTNFDRVTESEESLAKLIIDTVTKCQFNECEDCPLYEVDGCSRQEKVIEWLQKELESK